MVPSDDATDLEEDESAKNWWWWQAREPNVEEQVMPKNALVEYLVSVGAVGAKAAVRRAVVSHHMGCSQRDLRLLSEESRLNADMDAGIVCYCNKGLFVAGFAVEVEGQLATLHRECWSRLRQRRAMRRALHSVGQKTLFS
jgi:hypothetical protein